MSALKHAGSFRDLIVYQKSRQLQREIKDLTMSFPRDEMFSLTDQIRRSSRSIGANIAESWAKRRYEKHFISKLTDADGEQMETQHWIETALESGYIDQKTSASLMEKCLEIGRMLNGMMDKADLFCGEPPRSMREEPAEYFVDAHDDPFIETDH
ncbi:MAG: four helix bundle protein [Anaerolineales bacterium]|nr:four helix bundle protein [Anaerolineales bacterium]NUQ84717.1 four helix bundle protein [Anaerolineales bacterium]